ncbi:hypothetical protein [Rufibacter psychrotolerans]|uniref:hypothetical protein n=1 Tax=Rufibacter psychrotolerans TaxID=2812556 RepID=UPI0019689807|nr:hypothetical protein [Rufibacter sp. SYSU D00308]
MVEKKNFRNIAVKTATSGFDAEMMGGVGEMPSEGTPAKDLPEPERLQAADPNELKPFATRLPVWLIQKMQQHQYWNRESIMDTVINAVEVYLANNLDADKPLPAAVAAKKKNRKKRSVK